MTDTEQLESTNSTDVKDAAKEQAQSVAATTKDEATNVVGTAKEQVQAVTTDLRDQTRQLTDEARSQLTEHANAQRDNAVESLRSVGDELTGMAQHADTPGIGAQLTREAGSMALKTADFLADREPGQLVEELRGLARRRPGAFLLGAAAAGLLAGRVARSAKSAHSSPSTSQPTDGTPSAGVTDGRFSAPTPTAAPLAEPDVWGPDSAAYPGSGAADNQLGVIR